MITSTHNPRLQQVRALLARRKEREQTGLFVVEGVRLVEEAFAAGWQPHSLLYSSDLSGRGRALIDLCARRGGHVEEVEARLLASSADTDSPQGVLAVFHRRDLPLPPALDFVVVADALRDPGNLGTLLRSAAAAGAQAALLAPATVDAFAPKVLRAGMGAQFRLPVRELAWPDLGALLKPRCAVYVAEAEGGAPLWQVDLRRPTALVIGGEAEGAGPQALALADGLVRIPMPGAGESLNAGVAAGILLFEVVRQRAAGSPAAPRHPGVP